MSHLVMVKGMQLKTFLNSFSVWVINQASIEAVAYVGSHARGTAHEGSDLDLMILTNESDTFLENSDWVADFGPVREIKREDWGAVQTWRVWYEDGLEIEFNIAEPSWASIEPIDPGTQKVVQEGMKIIYDPQGYLAKLQAQIPPLTTHTP